MIRPANAPKNSLGSRAMAAFFPRLKRGDDKNPDVPILLVCLFLHQGPTIQEPIRSKNPPAWKVRPLP
jgi:hypothetical protein